MASTEIDFETNDMCALVSKMGKSFFNKRLSADLERKIMVKPEIAVMYFNKIDNSKFENGRWAEAEPYIAQSYPAMIAYRKRIRGHETKILKKATYAFEYARYVLHSHNNVCVDNFVFLELEDFVIPKNTLNYFFEKEYFFILLLYHYYTSIKMENFIYDKIRDTLISNNASKNSAYLRMYLLWVFYNKKTYEKIDNEVQTVLMSRLHDAKHAMPIYNYTGIKEIIDFLVLYICVFSDRWVALEDYIFSNFNVEQSVKWRIKNIKNISQTDVYENTKITGIINKSTTPKEFYINALSSLCSEQDAAEFILKW